MTALTRYITTTTLNFPGGEALLFLANSQVITMNVYKLFFFFILIFKAANSRTQIYEILQKMICSLFHLMTYTNTLSLSKQNSNNHQSKSNTHELRPLSTSQTIRKQKTQTNVDEGHLWQKEIMHYVKCQQNCSFWFAFYTKTTGMNWKTTNVKDIDTKLFFFFFCQIIVNTSIFHI